MSAKGRPYTMKELKGIVEYLTDHNAYGDVRARKMWMDFASSGLTSRTWQSLKETFLKRILPDIHNPYYKLTKDQIRSFRIGQDVTNTNVNKLEINTVANDESASKDNNTASAQPSTSNNVKKEEGNTSGEENKVSKNTSRRESVETVILGTDDCCYSNAELIKLLESPGASPQADSKKSKKKNTHQDLIIFSDPLYPCMQETDNVFVAEPEDHNVLEPMVIITTQKEESSGGIDLKTDTEGVAGTVQITGEGEMTRNEIIEDWIDDKLNEMLGSPKKKSLQLKKGDNNSAAKAKKTTKSISSETITTIAQVVENTLPQQINKDKLARTCKIPENLSTETNSAIVQETENSASSMRFNKDKKNTTNKKTISFSPETIISDGKRLKSIVLGEINKCNANEANKTIINLCTEENSSNVLEVENDIPEKNIKDKETKIDSIDTNKNVLSGTTYEESKGKANKETVTTFTETNGYDLEIIKNVSAENENSTASKTAGNKSNDILLSNDGKINNSSVTLNTNKTVENSSSTITDSLIPNNQEALLGKTNDKETQSQKKEEVAPITTEKISGNTKTDNVVAIENAQIPTNKVFTKSHKRQRKLYSTSESTVALSKVKTTIGEVNEESEDESSNSSKKLKTIEENTTSRCPKSSKQVNVLDNVKNLEAVAVISKNPVEAMQEDIRDTQETHQSTNPCLQSVSLFAEQFIELKSESDDDDAVTVVNNKKDKKPCEKNHKDLAKTKNTDNEVLNLSTSPNNLSIDPNFITNRFNIVMLKSHSDSESTEDIQLHRKRTHRDVSRSQKKEVLNNLFGNTSGGVVKRRHRKTSHVNGLPHRKNFVRISSEESSEWLSESDDEYVSPPHSRSRKAKRYLRPQSTRILQMGQEGGLFVAVGKNVYPLVRDDGRAISYINYMSGDESEENDSYWKLKYVKERKRNGDLSKLLERANDNSAEKLLKPATFNSPILPTRSSRTVRHISSDYEIQTNGGFKGQEVVVPKQLEKNITIKDKEEPKQETVKIKYAKNNEEVCLEGHWQNVHTILSDVMQVFKDSEKRNTDSATVLSSSKSTPIATDDEARKKVDELENEIFNKIEELDKSERSERVPGEGRITVRKRGRPTKISLDSPRSSVKSVKKTKRAKTSDTDSVTDNSKKTTPTGKTSTESDTTNSKRKTKSKVAAEKPTDIAVADKTRTRSKQTVESETPTKKDARLSVESGSVADSEIIVNESRLQLIESEPVPSKRIIKQPAKLSYGEAQPRPKQEKPGPTTIPDDSQVLYKFPSPGPETETDPPVRRPPGRPTRTKKYLPRTPQICSEETQNSIESSQGYQDSDLSPQSGNFKRKKKYSLPTYKAKHGKRYSRNFRRHTFNAFECDASSESSNSTFRFPIRNITITNSSLNTEAYRSESYQVLVPKSRYFFSLERITESPCPNQMDPKCDENRLQLSPASQNLGSELGNSSNVSLPMSPELSIVEHISVGKTELERLPEHPTINETISNVEMKSQYRESYVISTLDVSVPLMQQTCNFHVYQDPGTCNFSGEGDRQDSALTSNTSQASGIPSVTTTTFPESLLDRMDTASIEENVTTDDLDVRLTNMLLESAKKIASQNRKAKITSDKENVETKKPGKKISSTPRKKRERKKSQTPTVGPVIEECMEYCHSGRKSCPPVICDNSLVATAHTVTKTAKAKTPKEIIKIKITRPKNKNGTKRPNTRSQSRMSVLTDSGITDTSTSILFQSINESVDLIHNHSETCLHGHDCFDFMGKSPGSIDTSVDGKEEECGMKRRRQVRDIMTPEFFSCDAQSASYPEKSSQESSVKDSQPGTQFLSAHCSSLMTEDLSDEPPPPKYNDWYLPSEDMPSLQHFPRPASCSVSSSYGSNLRKLFPVVCSVPDLSDITEFSRETDVNSLKSTRNTDLDSNMRSEFMLSDFNDDFIANTNE